VACFLLNCYGALPNNSEVCVHLAVTLNVDKELFKTSHFCIYFQLSSAHVPCVIRVHLISMWCTVQICSWCTFPSSVSARHLTQHYFQTLPSSFLLSVKYFQAWVRLLLPCVDVSVPLFHTLIWSWNPLAIENFVLNH